MDLSNLIKLLNTHFNLEEIRTLCFELGIDYDSLGGEGKEGKVRELVKSLQRRNILHKLIIRITELRPNVEWISSDSMFVPNALDGASKFATNNWAAVGLLIAVAILGTFFITSWANGNRDESLINATVESQATQIASLLTDQTSEVESEPNVVTREVTREVTRVVEVSAELPLSTPIPTRINDIEQYGDVSFIGPYEDGFVQSWELVEDGTYHWSLFTEEGGFANIVPQIPPSRSENFLVSVTYKILEGTCTPAFGLGIGFIEHSEILEFLATRNNNNECRGTFGIQRIVAANPLGFYSYEDRALDPLNPVSELNTLQIEVSNYEATFIINDIDVVGESLDLRNVYNLGEDEPIYGPESIRLTFQPFEANLNTEFLIEIRDFYIELR